MVTDDEFQLMAHRHVGYDEEVLDLIIQARRELPIGDLSLQRQFEICVKAVSLQTRAVISYQKDMKNYTDNLKSKDNHE